MRERVRTVVFDRAGTTVDHGCMAPVEAFTEALAAHGIEVGEADVRRPMGRPKRDHLVALLSLPAVAASWAERHGRSPAEQEVDRLDTYPLGQMVKVGDTVLDVLEGRAAGMWTVGTLLGGSPLGLSRDAEAALGPAELEERLAAAGARLREAGAHYVVRSIADLPEAAADIDRRLSHGEDAAGAGPGAEGLAGDRSRGGRLKP